MKYFLALWTCFFRIYCIWWAEKLDFICVSYLEVHRITSEITSSVSINSHPLWNVLEQDSEFPTYTLPTTYSSKNVLNVTPWWNSVTSPEMSMPRDATLTWCLHRRPVSLGDISSEWREKTKRWWERNIADTHLQRSGQEGEQTITRSRCLLMDKAASAKAACQPSK